MDASRLLASPTPTTLIPSLAFANPSLRCETTISVGGVLSFGPGIPATTLTHAAVLETPCAPGQTPEATIPPYVLADAILDNQDDDEAEAAQQENRFSTFRDPFYQSLFPVFYVLAATTVTAYMLVVMLFITPRSFLDGGIVYLGRRGFTGGSSAGIRIGGRPWLQKVAAMTVAISLTIATADTFRVTERQYYRGVQNAPELQVKVMDSTELKIMRLVSDTFLWLAQAQTLIRLFPRQREKVIIKWTAFALITLQVIFSALNSFYYLDSGSQGNGRPTDFLQAVPTMSYLFHLSLGFLYAAWVIYYSLMKKRYAFYHPLMKNMILVSTLSLFSILLPVVFFILDLLKKEFIGWGDYVRWVGAAAASVIVWEWVERIEALEREEKKDGILGREVFDGDEMMEVSASEFPWLRRRRNRKSGPGGGMGGGAGGARGGTRGFGGGDGGDGGGQARSTAARLMVWPGLTSIPPRYQGNFQQDQLQQQAESGDNAQAAQASSGAAVRPPLWPARPAPAITPMSRTETASATSTDYAVRYQPMSETTGRTPDVVHEDSNNGRQQNSISDDARTDRDVASRDERPTVVAPVPRQAGNATRAIDPEAQTDAGTGRSRWRSLAQAANPLFRRNNSEAPASVAAHAPSTRPEGQPRRRDGYEGGNRWDLRARLEDFAVTQAEKIRERMQPTPETDSLPERVIPAPPRQGAALAQLLEEEGGNVQRGSSRDPLERSMSEGSAFSHFPGLGGAEASNLDRTASNMSSQRSPGASQSTESPVMNPNQPPLWPGVQRRYDYDDDMSRRPPTP